MQMENTDTFIIDLHNMVLGGLIALRSEQEVGNVNRSLGSETIFLGKWLKRIKKQKCYPKSIANEIDNLLVLYAKKGRSAGLSLAFEKLHNDFQYSEIKTVLNECIEEE
jgi:hypothetical protein